MQVQQSIASTSRRARRFKQLEDIGGFAMSDSELPNTEMHGRPDALPRDLDDVRNGAMLHLSTQESRQARQPQPGQHAHAHAAQGRASEAASREGAWPPKNPPPGRDSIDQMSRELHTKVQGRAEVSLLSTSAAQDEQQEGQPKAFLQQEHRKEVVYEDLPQQMNHTEHVDGRSRASVGRSGSDRFEQTALFNRDPDSQIVEGPWRRRLSMFWGVDAGVEPKRSPQNHLTMVSKIKVCKNWEDILHMVHTEGLADGVDLSTALHRLQHLVGEAVFSLPADDLEALKVGVQDILQRLLEAMKHQGAVKRQQTISMTLLSLARLHFSPDARSMAILCDIGLSCALRYTPQAIANTMCALVLLDAAEAEGAELLDVLTDRALTRVRLLPSRNLSKKTP
jgi:hypothetical protein